MPARSSIKFRPVKENNQIDQVSFTNAFMALVVIVLFIGVSIGVALFFNTQRKTQIIATYDQETNQFIQDNQEEIKQFYTQTFSDCRQELADQQAAQPNSSYPAQDVICQSAQDSLAALGVNSLKDSSAIAYLRYEDGHYELIEASGKYNKKRTVMNSQDFSHFNYDQEKRTELNNYLENNIDINRWQDFIQYISGKEVLVPVVVDKQTIGYIFRGVIER